MRGSHHKGKLTILSITGRRDTEKKKRKGQISLVRLTCLAMEVNKQPHDSKPLPGERREEASEEEWNSSSECQRKNKLRLWLVSKKKSKKEKLCSFEFGLRQGEGCKQNCVVVLPY